MPSVAEVLVALDDRREVVPRELARLRREVDVAVREQDLRLRDAAGVEDDLARMRVAGRVLGAEPEVEVAERDPACLARPADVDDPRLERQEPPERGDRLRRVRLLEARGELEPACGDPEHRRDPTSPAAPETYAATAAISSGESFPAKDGITPSPFVTRSATSAADGLAASRSGPTVPVAPASESVWQAAHPAEAKTCLPSATSAGVGRRGGGVVGPLDPDRQRDERERAGDRHPPVRPSRVAEVVEEPRPRADRHQHDQHEPRVVGAVGEREVPREHRQQHRQREVVVLDRALLRLDARSGVGLATRLLRADELALRRDDVEEDVRGHHRPDHRPDLEPRGPRAEELGRAPRGECDEHEEHRPQHARVRDEPVEDVVDDPRGREEPDRDRDGEPRVEVVARLDERARRLEVVEDEHQRRSRRATSCTPPT